MSQSSASLLDAWRAIHKAGYSLVPLQAKGKKASVPWTQYQHVKPTVAEIKDWLAAFPDCNPGVITGKLSRVIVLDIDGDDAIASLLAAKLHLPDTAVVRTARGWHYYFQYPELQEGQRIVTKAGVMLGIDSRGDGGYVVGPGSIHETGAIYEWADDVTVILPAPQWWLDLVVTSTPDPYAVSDAEYKPRQTDGIDDRRARAYVMAALAGEVAKVEAASDGTKHDRLLYSAIALAGFIPYLEEYEIEGALFNAIAPRAADKNAARKTIRDGMAYGERRPREIPDAKERTTEAYTNAVPEEVRHAEQPKEEPQALPKNRWEPIPVTDLVQTEDTTKWIWGGYIAPRSFTSLTAVHKSGKTTLLSHLYGELSVPNGMFLGQATTGCKVLCISEEPEHNWIGRRETLSLQENLHLICKPFITNPDQRAWETFLKYITDQILMHDYGLVVFDTLPHLWAVKDESDGAQVRQALVPLYALTEAGAAVLFVMHPSKGDKGEGMSYRGSGALGGFFNILVEMRRMHQEDLFDTNRVIQGFSHYDATPKELVIQYEQGIGYEVKGDRQQAERDSRKWALEQVLPRQAPGYTIEELLEDWPTNAATPPKGILRSDLDYLASQSPAYVKTGKGNRAEPFRFWFCAGNERWNKAA